MLTIFKRDSLYNFMMFTILSHVGVAAIIKLNTNLLKVSNGL